MKRSNDDVSSADLLLTRVVESLLSDWQACGHLLTEPFIRELLLRAREVVMAEPMLLLVDAPVKICGDIHGQMHDLVAMINSGKPPPQSTYLFLGDYVDRGKHGTECIVLLLGLKLLYPGNMFILRGNHEAESVNTVYGFFDECKRRYSLKLFKDFCNFFNCLPLCALIEGRALCMHGGISPHLHSLDQITQLKRPLPLLEDVGLAIDILWSDPDESVPVGFQSNERGVGVSFSASEVHKTCAHLDLDLIVRAHQVVQKGYQFFAGRSLVTVFSASNYCGLFSNCGAMLLMDEDLRCKFQVFKPKYE